MPTCDWVEVVAFPSRYWAIAMMEVAFHKSLAGWDLFVPIDDVESIKTWLLNSGLSVGDADSVQVPPTQCRLPVNHQDRRKIYGALQELFGDNVRIVDAPR
jgi:hypothetical protein